MKIPATLALGLVLASCLTAFGHVTVAPAKSSGTAPETFTFRVPSEGGRTTTGLVLTVPKGVTVLSVAGLQGGRQRRLPAQDRRPTGRGGVEP